jgi:hypothetical protein
MRCITYHCEKKYKLSKIMAKNDQLKGLSHKMDLAFDGYAWSVIGLNRGPLSSSLSSPPSLPFPFSYPHPPPPPVISQIFSLIDLAQPINIPEIVEDFSCRHLRNPKILSL